MFGIPHLRVRSGSLAFPRPSPALPVTGRALEVFRAHRRASVSPPPHSSTLVLVFPAFSSAAFAAPSGAPPPTRLLASTPGSGSHLLLRLSGATRGDLDPSMRFLTAPTVCSARSLRACCIPLPALGFASFCLVASHRPTTMGPRRVPRSAPPLEECPPCVAVPHHCGHLPS